MTSGAIELEYKTGGYMLELDGRPVSDAVGKAGSASTAPPQHTQAAADLAELKRQFDAITADLDRREQHRKNVERNTPRPGPGEAVYRELLDESIALITRDYARDTLEEACEALGLDADAIAIRWVRKETEQDARERKAAVERYGYPLHPFHVNDARWTAWTAPTPAVIYIESSASILDIPRIVAHEARHRWQFRHWGRKDLQSAAGSHEYEADADAFADRLGFTWRTV